MPLLTLIACGRGSVGAYGQSVDEFLVPELARIDRGIELLMIELERSEVISFDTSRDILHRASAHITLADRIESDGDPVVGLYAIGGDIRIVGRSCLASTALLHEFTHLIQAGAEIDDPKHLRLEWWHASEVAQVYWARETCVLRDGRWE